MAERSKERIRYAVVGLGHIAQAAMLPAFENAENSELVALVSHDDEKLKKLGKKYGIEKKNRVHYDQFEELLDRGQVDAVYIALPNHLHAEYTHRAAKKGVHVLCEKPLGVTAQECREMIEVCEKEDVLLMTAYRLHFEEANLEVMNLAQRGEIGELRFFQSTFSQNVSDEGDIRLLPLEKGGGTLYDMGIYCINAARYLFGDEPIDATAVSTRRNADPRFSKSDEMTAATLRFPKERLASFVSSFGGANISTFRLVGTEGEIRLEWAYKYAMESRMTVRVGEEEWEKTFEARDQFGPQLIYFSQCIIEGIDPEPDGYEGLGDVEIIEALYESSRHNKPVTLTVTPSKKRPVVEQIIIRPPVEKPEEIKASSPSK